MAEYLSAGNAISGYWTDSTIAPSTIAIAGNWNEWGKLSIAASKPKPETNLEWLDKRVNEMRVSL